MIAKPISPKWKGLPYIHIINPSSTCQNMKPCTPDGKSGRFCHAFCSFQSWSSPRNGDSPKTCSILIGTAILNHPLWGFRPCVETPINHNMFGCWWFLECSRGPRLVCVPCPDARTKCARFEHVHIILEQHADSKHFKTMVHETPQAGPWQPGGVLVCPGEVRDIRKLHSTWDDPTTEIFKGFLASCNCHFMCHGVTLKEPKGQWKSTGMVHEFRTNQICWKCCCVFASEKNHDLENLLGLEQAWTYC